MSTAPGKRRQAALAGLLLLLSVTTVEGASRVVLLLSRSLLDEEIRPSSEIWQEQTVKIRRLLEPDSSRLLVLDSVLGWRYRAGHRDSGNQTNAQGLRSTRDYTRAPRPGVLRVSAFGDSFVYCNEVNNAASWPALLEQMYPSIEVLNYGVGGYGVDQAYLRYVLEGAELSPRVVIIGFATMDLPRVSNVYRRFIANGEIPLTKPRFVLDDAGDLVLIPNPVPTRAGLEKYLLEPRAIRELGANDAWYEPLVYENPLYDVSGTVRLVSGLWVRVRRRYLEPDRLQRGGVFSNTSSAFRLQVALFEAFSRRVRAVGAAPVVLFFPDPEAIQRASQGRPTLYAPLEAELHRRGIVYLDLTDAFLQAHTPESLDGWFMPGGHYSAEGNRIVASWLGARLQARFE